MVSLLLQNRLQKVSQTKLETPQLTFLSSPATRWALCTPQSSPTSSLNFVGVLDVGLGPVQLVL